MHQFGDQSKIKHFRGGVYRAALWVSNVLSVKMAKSLVPLRACEYCWDRSDEFSNLWNLANTATHMQKIQDEGFRKINRIDFDNGNIVWIESSYLTPDMHLSQISSEVSRLNTDMERVRYIRALYYSRRGRFIKGQHNVVYMLVK